MGVIGVEWSAEFRPCDRGGSASEWLKEDHLRREKIMDVDASPAAVLLAGFRSWLVAERGLSAETVRCYCNQASTFLASLPEPVDSSVQQLDSGRVTSFMVGHCRGRNRWSAKAMATSLRALLRYLHLCGHTPTGLVGAVPGVAGWRLASLPRGLAAAVVARLLGSCDRATVVGRRDYAILLVLARLGLRVDGAGTQNRAAAAQNPLYRLIEP